MSNISGSRNLQSGNDRQSKLWLALLATLLVSTTVQGADQFEYVLQPGDTLIGLSNRLLQNPRNWVRLQQINRIADPYRMLPGTIVRIPTALLLREPAVARITAVKGEATADERPLAVGNSVSQGARVGTGKQSFVTIELIDGSHLVLQPSSRLQVQKLMRVRATGRPETELRLEQGRVESTVNKRSGEPEHFIVTTPGATIGVRGTRFRVARADGEDAVRAEVAEGTIGVGTARTGRAIAAVPAGFGLLVDKGKMQAPVPLLPPPDLSNLPKLQERPLLTFAWPAVEGARGYRAQIGALTHADDLEAEALTEQPAIKLASLADGQYNLRVRAIDANGIEGTDANMTFTLKARPEPPFAMAPIGGAKVSGTTAALTWSASTDASSYRIQLSNEENFAQPIVDLTDIQATTVLPTNELPPGKYFWRVRSIAAADDTGPWGDVQAFTLKPLPKDPEPPEISDQEIRFAWSGEPGQTFLFQLARDEGFTRLVDEHTTTAPATVIHRPEAGTYFLRVRATDADGFVGPFTTIQRMEVPARLSWQLLILLLPAL